jgi:hypothetical protein
MRDTTFIKTDGEEFDLVKTAHHFSFSAVNFLCLIFSCCIKVLGESDVPKVGEVHRMPPSPMPPPISPSATTRDRCAHFSAGSGCLSAAFARHPGTTAECEPVVSCLLGTDILQHPHP